MNLVKVGAAVLNQTPLDWDRNKCNILQAIDQARQEGVSILCLPELCISGYGCEDAFLSPAMLRTAWEVLKEIVPASRGLIVSVGIPLLYNNVVFNSAALLADGRIAGFVGKRYLAGEGIHYEPRWFKPWPLGQQVSLSVDGESYPFGDLYFNCGGVRIGFEICEDAWVADRPGGNMYLKGVDVILNPSASHFAFDKHDVRRRFVLEGSRAFGVTYVYSNLLGNEAGRAIYDGGALIASGGRMLCQGPRFSYHPFLVTAVSTDLDLTRMSQARSAGRQPLSGPSTECIAVDFVFPKVRPEPVPEVHPSWEDSSNLKEEEFARATSLGLFDYLRKSRSEGFVVSLSGGADSSAVSCLVSLMVRFGTRELGLKAFKERLTYISGLASCQSDREIVATLLSCVYQSTRNSTEVTRSAARSLSEAIGATFYELDVDPLVEGYKKLAFSALGRDLTWEADDLAMQNIQARARGPSVWLLANVKRALLLATSNRSEAAVGYATMDGDTCGGLSPIAGIDKAFLRTWLRWLEEKGPDGLQPIPALRAVNIQAPTAELRPAEQGQTDEGDLMPYDLLDAIERAAIRDKKSPLEVFQLMKTRFNIYSPQQLGFWTDRFFRLWCRNQWKRERYAPSFHVDDENLDPKTWCRFPILSGGFERELAELSELLRQEAAEELD